MQHLTEPMPLSSTPNPSEAAPTDLRGFTRPQLSGWLATQWGASQARSRRLFQAIWQQGAPSVSAITGVHKGLVRDLARQAVIQPLAVDRVLDSQDGTRKIIWRLHDGHRIESVLIPDGHRLTLCVSTQVGCAMGCAFCLTGDMGLKRHLTVAEIASQPLQAGQLAAARGQRLTNLVFMGMGEPLHNLDALLPALDVCLDDLGLNFSHRRVTVSTVGLIPQMIQLVRHSPVNLAVSVNATTEEQRQAVMPITRKYALAALMATIRTLAIPATKRITIEYVMMAGVNDTLADAARLFALLEGVPVKVNLIPYNENPNRAIRAPTPKAVKAFQGYFVNRGHHCSIRTTRGIDISAACGQLGPA